MTTWFFFKHWFTSSPWNFCCWVRAKLRQRRRARRNGCFRRLTWQHPEQDLEGSHYLWQLQPVVNEGVYFISAQVLHRYPFYQGVPAWSHRKRYKTDIPHLHSSKDHGGLYVRQTSTPVGRQDWSSAAVCSQGAFDIRCSPIQNYFKRYTRRWTCSGKACAQAFFAYFTKGFDLIDHTILIQELDVADVTKKHGKYKNETVNSLQINWICRKFDMSS